MESKQLIINFSSAEYMPSELFYQMASYLSLQDLVIMRLTSQFFKKSTESYINKFPHQVAQMYVAEANPKVAICLIKQFHLDKTAICKTLIKSFKNKPSIRTFLQIGVFYQADLAVDELKRYFYKRLEIGDFDQYSWLKSVEKEGLENLHTLIAYFNKDEPSCFISQLIVDIDTIFQNLRIKNNFEISKNFLRSLMNYSFQDFIAIVNRRFANLSITPDESKLKDLILKNPCLVVIELLVEPRLKGLVCSYGYNKDRYYRSNNNEIDKQMIADHILLIFRKKFETFKEYLSLKLRLIPSSSDQFKQILRDFLCLSMENFDNTPLSLQIAKFLFENFITKDHLEERLSIIREFINQSYPLKNWFFLLEDLPFDVRGVLIVEFIDWNFFQRTEGSFLEGFSAIKHLESPQRFLCYKDAINRFLASPFLSKTFFREAKVQLELEYCINDLLFYYKKEVNLEFLNLANEACSLLHTNKPAL